MVLGFVFSWCTLETYGDNTVMKKGINNGSNLRLLMVSSVIFYYLNSWKFFCCCKRVIINVSEVCCLR